MKRITFLMALSMLFTWQVNAQFGCGSAVALTNGYTASAITTPGTSGAEDWNTNPTGTSINANYWDDDVYLFEYTNSGTVAEQISMTIYTRKTYTGIGIFDDCTGTAFSNELDANGSSAGNTSRTVTTIVAAGNTVYIAVGQWGTPNDLDFDVTSFTASSCIAPTGLAVSNITTTTADVTWTDASGGTQFDYEYIVQTTGTGIPAAANGTGTDVSATTANATALTAATDYEVYVRAECSATSFSSWVGPVSFSTPCNAVTSFPFTEEFEGITTGQPNCWGIAGTTTTASYHWNSYSTGQTGRGMRFNSYTNSSGRTSELTTPIFDLSSLSTAQLSFYFKNPTGGNFEVLISTDGGTTYTSLENNLTGQSSWLQKTYNITSHIGNNVKIQFKGTSNYGSGDAYIYLDDVNVEEVPSCVAPTALTASNITATSADLGWTEQGSATTWNIEWGATGFTQGTGTAVTGTTTNPHNLTALTAATTYDFYVQADCGGGDTSTWSGPFTFTTLCVAMTDFNENFDGVTAPDLPTCWAGITDGGASSFASVRTYTSTSPNSGTNHVRLYNSSSVASSNIILVSPIVSNLNAGTHRLRFYAKNSSATQDLEVGTITNPADGTTFTSLQAVDIDGTYTEYTVNFNTYSGTDQYIAIRRLSTSTYTSVYLDDIVWEAAPSCLAPTALTATNVMTTSADLGWTEAGSATTWNIEWGATGFTQGSGTAVTVTATSSHNLTALTANTTYDFYVQADCGGGDTSTWSGPFSFSTSCVPYSIPYNEGFETGYTHNTDVGGCLVQESEAGTNNWTVNNTYTNYNRSPRTGNWNAFLRYSNTDWFFIPITLTAGTSYRAQLYARQDGTTTTNASIAISYGTTATAAGMTNVIVADTGLDDTYQKVYGDFTPTTTGVYYIGYKGTINGFPWYISIDDIAIDETSTLATTTFNSSAFVAYPNPVHNVLNLEYNTAITNVRVINLLGQEVINQNVNTTNAQIDMSRLNAGTYMVNVTIDDIVKTIKVIKK